MSQRVAITGIGVVSPIGIGYDEFADSVAQGVSGLGPWSAWAEPRLVGEVLDFQANDYFVAEKTYLDRCSEFALAAAKLALDHAGLTAMPAPEERSGIVLNTDGCLETMVKYRDRVKSRGIRFATPLMFSHAEANIPASLISIDFRLKGYHVTTCACGGAALQTALVGMLAGHSDAVLAGGACALPPSLAADWQLGLPATDDPDEFDPQHAAGKRARGEGACLLLLEAEMLARSRGASVYGWLSLDGAPADAWHVTSWHEHEQAGHRPTVDTATPLTLYGSGPASGALDAAAALAGLHAGVLPPLRGGDEALEARREPQARAAAGAVLHDLSVHGSPTSVVVSLP